MARAARLSRRHMEGVVPMQAPHREGVSATDVGVVPRKVIRRVPWGRFVVLATAVYALWMGHVELRNYHTLKIQEASLRAQAVKLRQQRTQLQQEVAYASTDQYVAQAAAQEFGLVKKGQVPLAPVSGKASNTAAGSQG